AEDPMIGLPVRSYMQFYYFLASVAVVYVLTHFNHLPLWTLVFLLFVQFCVFAESFILALNLKGTYTITFAYLFTMGHGAIFVICFERLLYWDR
ncbi:MAG: hypothetical protein Q8R25_00250, partial [bacterium]|nr:hypothetical protein [bacterium]